MKRFSIYFAVLFLFTILGCSNQGTLNPIPGSTGEEAGSPVDATSRFNKIVPHKGNIFFYPTAVNPTGDPLIVRISYEGEGNASHFGHFTETGEYLLHSDANGTPLFISDVTATRFTANGDQVFLANVTGVISLTGDPEHPLILEGDFNYDGGTGRFEGVSGNLHWRAIGNPDGSALSNFEGTISTVGSGK